MAIGWENILVRCGLAALQKIPWGRVWDLLIFPKGRYKQRLQKKLIEMPFLFGDMQLSARDDYVELDVLTLSGSWFRHKTTTGTPNRGAFPKFEAFRKAFIFADGGFGKTTLFRNLALEAIKARPWKKCLGVRGILPVYVPLKVVQTAEDFAIVSAIQASDRYFAGSTGLRRLRRLGAKGKLLILLDGYDEMPYTGGFEHVKREIEVLFENNVVLHGVIPNLGMVELSQFERSAFWPVYKAIRSSRVYLSSRKEFFDYNPINSSSDTQKWMVRGLDDRRISLVEKIFSKYRSRTVNSSGKDLNAELFLQTLSRSDESVVEMSKSPLFLTVMCYVYVTQNAGEGRSVFTLGSSDLVRTCIGLLLEDLDKYKSREFDAATKQAMANRRSAYPEEKLAFLKYFSVRLYAEDRGYFDETFVTNAAKEYFRSASQHPFSVEILRGLESSDAAVNIVRQVIMSGLFVLVDKRSDVRIFDFPHRKFREVLAVDYFLAMPLDDDLANRLVGKKYSELALLFVEQSNHSFLVVNKLIDRILSRSGDGHEQGLLIDVLKRLPKESAEAAVHRLLKGIGQNSRVSLQLGIWDFFPATISNCSYLSARMREALNSKSEFLLKEWAVASVRVGCGECEKLVLAHSWGDDALPLMRVLVESGLIKLESGKDFLRRYVELSVRYDESKDVVALLLYTIFYAGRSKLERNDFVAWADTMGRGSQRERHVCAKIKELIASDD